VALKYIIYVLSIKVSNETGLVVISEDEISFLHDVSMVIGAFNKTRLQKWIEFLSTRATRECLATLNR
jgi:hypothetical protein